MFVPNNENIFVTGSLANSTGRVYFKKLPFLSFSSPVLMCGYWWRKYKRYSGCTCQIHSLKNTTCVENFGCSSQWARTPRNEANTFYFLLRNSISSMSGFRNITFEVGYHHYRSILFSGSSQMKKYILITRNKIGLTCSTRWPTRKSTKKLLKWVRFWWKDSAETEQ